MISFAGFFIQVLCTLCTILVFVALAVVIAMTMVVMVVFAAVAVSVPMVMLERTDALADVLESQIFIMFFAEAYDCRVIFVMMSEIKMMERLGCRDAGAPDNRRRCDHRPRQNEFVLEQISN